MIGDDYKALRDGFSSVGGTNMQSEDDKGLSYTYWSSTEGSRRKAWQYLFGNKKGGYCDMNPESFLSNFRGSCHDGRFFLNHHSSSGGAG